MFLTHLVLHPRHKLEYFRKNHWDDSLIEVAHDIVQDEFDRMYWLLDIENNGTTPAHASGNGPVSCNFVNFLVAPLLIPNLNDTIQVSTSSEQTNMFDNIMDTLAQKTIPMFGHFGKTDLG